MIKIAKSRRVYTANVFETVGHQSNTNNISQKSNVNTRNYRGIEEVS